MTFLPNSSHARDIASIVHSQTDLNRHLEVGPSIMSSGDGVYVTDSDGRRLIEGVAGLWCASLGFGVERLAEVAYEAMKNIGYYHTYRHTSNEAAIDLAEKLLSIAPVPMSKVLFQCSGSEANDTAIKLVWYYHNAIGKPDKRKIIGRMKGYHGSTAAAVSLSGKPDMHRDFNLPFEPFRHTDFPCYYLEHQDGETEDDFATRMADNLEALILEEGPETVGAFFAEPIMGAGGGIIPPPTYYEKIQAVLKKYDVLLVADEVICGYGRTGNMWGSTTMEMVPDMISSAKQLSAGFQPISALLINEKVFQAMLVESDKLGSFSHGYTYAGHPVAAAVALEVQKIYEEIDVVATVRKSADYLAARLSGLGDHPNIDDVDGRGLLWGMQVVKDRTTRALYDPALGMAQKIGDATRDAGAIVRIIGDRIVLAPPLVISEGELDQLVGALETGLAATAFDG